MRGPRRFRLVVAADGPRDGRDLRQGRRPVRDRPRRGHRLAGGRGTLGRFAASDAQALNRLTYYRTTWEAIWDRPLLGTGYGTYADAFRAYNHPDTGTYFLDKAHNTYLQVIMELGWPAAAALYSGLALLVFRSLQAPLPQGGTAALPAVLAACSVLVAVHALVDFSLEMPANAATYALLLGVGCARTVRSGAARSIS